MFQFLSQLSVSLPGLALYIQIAHVVQVDTVVDHKYAKRQMKLISRTFVREMCCFFFPDEIPCGLE
jgi:hypothetical protein